MINDLAKLIAINSTCGEPEFRAPFGKANRKVLDTFLGIAKDYGLKTGDDDGYAGWAEYGDGDALIGVLGHLDIVPAGSGWASDPFKLVTENGKLYGRGVSDDKGPVIACLHAIKRLKEENADLGCRVRLIVGCNEESGSECIKHYVKHMEIPVASFTPDSDFPVVASEKAIVHVKFTVPVSLEGVSDVRGGERANIVPNAASLTLTPDGAIMDRLSALPVYADIVRVGGVAERLATDGCDMGDFEFLLSADGLTISAKGVAAHGSCPNKGDNAIRKVLSLLAALTEDEGVTAVCDFLASPYAAARADIDIADETGRLTLNLGICRLIGNNLELTVDLRLPQSANPKAVIAKLGAKLPADTKTEVLHLSEALAFAENDPLIATLLDVYRRVTGDTRSRPLHIGGGTYAKELPNCVAFGAVFPDCETHMHEPDECYPVEDFYKLEEIYYQAIKALCEVYRA